VTQHSPRSAWILGLLCEVRTVGKMLAPERFIQFTQSIGMAEAKIGEIPTVELREQAPCSGALQAVQKPANQATQSIWARVGMAEVS